MDKVAALGIGIEIFIDNQAANEVDISDARSMGQELRDRGIVCTVHAPFMDLSPGRRRYRRENRQPGEDKKGHRYSQPSRGPGHRLSRRL